VSDFNARIIDEFRANGGSVAKFGSSLVLLHTVGARSGEARIHPLLAIPQSEGGWLIAASAAGAASSPAWYFNLRSHPDATIETGTDTVGVTATEVPDAEYAAAWAQFTARSSAFEGYQERARTRRIPLVLLTPR
jgi:deazaflavin-dependent oxidoreductase (nitroreductase family)